MKLVGGDSGLRRTEQSCWCRCWDKIKKLDINGFLLYFFVLCERNQRHRVTRKICIMRIQHCNISIIPICCLTLEELTGLARNQVCHGNVSLLTVLLEAARRRERQKKREIRREDEVEEEILRADVAAMVTNITHGGTNSTITNSFMFNGGVWVSWENVSICWGSGPPTPPTAIFTVQTHPEVTDSCWWQKKDWLTVQVWLMWNLQKDVCRLSWSPTGRSYPPPPLRA